jgi:hypothetical protein
VGFDGFFHLAELVGLRLSLFFLKVEGWNFSQWVGENVVAATRAGELPSAMTGKQAGIGEAPVGDVSPEQLGFQLVSLHLTARTLQNFLCMQAAISQNLGFP